MRLDTTVVETDVRHLTDTILPRDGIRLDRVRGVGTIARPAGTGTRSMVTSGYLAGAGGGSLGRQASLSRDVPSPSVRNA
jgi:hypothetical protein